MCNWDVFFSEYKMLMCTSKHILLQTQADQGLGEKDKIILKQSFLTAITLSFVHVIDVNIMLIMEKYMLLF